MRDLPSSAKDDRGRIEIEFPDLRCQPSPSWWPLWKIVKFSVLNKFDNSSQGAW